jgi:hypothetical protein
LEEEAAIVDELRPSMTILIRLELSGGRNVPA